MALKREATSCTNAWGRRAMIPIIMIIEIPFPTPLSVMRSPSHRMNMLPAARMMVAGTMNTGHDMPEARAWLA